MSKHQKKFDKIVQEQLDKLRPKEESKEDFVSFSENDLKTYSAFVAKSMLHFKNQPEVISNIYAQLSQEEKTSLELYIENHMRNKNKSKKNG